MTVVPEFAANESPNKASQRSPQTILGVSWLRSGPEKSALIVPAKGILNAQRPGTTDSLSPS